MHVVSHPLVANQRTRIHHPGRFFILIETGAALDVTFELNRSGIGEVGKDVQAGYKRFPGDWSNLDEGNFDTVVLTSAIAQTVVIGISQTAADYTRVVSVVQVEQPSTIVTTDDVTVGVAVGTIIAANTSRRQLILRALKANSGTIRVGETGIVAASRGTYLDAGDVLVLDTTAEVRGIATAAGQIVSIFEEQA